MAFPQTALISDLHGNWPALQVALADARTRGVERIACLGDVVGYGAKPRECLLELQRWIDPEAHGLSGLVRGFCLLGNHEQALLEGGADFNPNARAAIEWTRDQFLAGEREACDRLWDFLGALRPSHSEPGAMYVHGSPRDPVREYLLPRDIRDPAKMAANFKLMVEPVCFVGHSHVPAIYYSDGTFYRPKTSEGPYDLGDLAARKCIVNVGSVGQPRDGDARLSYVIFDGRNVTFRRLEYDVQEAQADIRAVERLPAYLADRLAVGH